MLRWSPHHPTDKQLLFLSLPHREILYGGAAGGGKSDALLMAALMYVDVPGYAALILRRTFADLSKPGALLDRAHQWLGRTAARWSERDKRWTFPSGASISFGYLENATDHYQYQGSEYQYIGFDELTQFPAHQYRYLFSRLRRLAGTAVPLRMRAGSNPGGTGHGWVKERFVDVPATVARCFVPATLDDNPYLDRAEYESSLDELDPVERARLRHGDWHVQREGLVFPGLESCVVPDCTPIPEGTAVGGIDWGWHNPFAALGAVLDHDDVLWVHYERYASQTTLGEHAAALPAGLTWWADPAGADQCHELRRAGHDVRPCTHIPTRGATAATGSVLASIDRTNRRIRTGRLRVLARCRELRREAGLYAFDPTKAQDNPIDADNHACSALRYLVTGLDRGYAVEGHNFQYEASRATEDEVAVAAQRSASGADPDAYRDPDHETWWN